MGDTQASGRLCSSWPSIVHGGSRVLQEAGGGLEIPPQTEGAWCWDAWWFQVIGQEEPPSECAPGTRGRLSGPSLLESRLLPPQTRTSDVPGRSLQTSSGFAGLKPCFHFLWPPTSGRFLLGSEGCDEHLCPVQTFSLLPAPMWQSTYGHQKSPIAYLKSDATGIFRVYL